MDKFKIEKNIPRESYGNGNTVRWAFMKDMEIGDSFAMPLSERAAQVGQGDVYSAAHRYNIKVSVRRNKKECRVWRIE